MEIEKPFVFQSDSEIVNKVYSEQSNYLIDYNYAIPKKYCILYFSSNDIYYPNTEAEFNTQIVEKNKFEWYGSRISYGHKHIFLRDIKKQWYLSGISSQFSDREAVLNFLKEETKEYKVIAIGSSAGGFAAVLFGQQLNAERIYSFNGQFELNSLLRRSTEKKDPLVFRNRENEFLKKQYDTRNFIEDPKTIYYFSSKNSNWDIEQYNHIKDLPINIILFNTSHHGIPFLKCNMKRLLEKDIQGLQELSKNVQHPFLFSLKMVGVIATFRGIYEQFIKTKIKRLLK